MEIIFANGFVKLPIISSDLLNEFLPTKITSPGFNFGLEAEPLWALGL